MINEKGKEVLNWTLHSINILESIWGAISKAPYSLKERVPGFLGISYKDEMLFEESRAKLTPEEDKRLTKFLNSCKDYERNRFRNIVAGIELNKSILLLKRIAKMVEDKKGIKAAYARCTSSGIIVKDPFCQRILDEWRKEIAWFKKTILDFFEVKEISEIITSQKIKKAYSSTYSCLKAAESELTAVESGIKKHKGANWWHRLFEITP